MPTGPSSTQTQNITAGMVAAQSAPAVSGGYLVAQVGIPVGIACTGSMGANGALTLGTALGATTPYASGAFLYFPAGAVYASSGAGFYLTKMASTTLGTVFNNIYIPANGLPSIPSPLVPVVDAGPGAYTGVTTLQAGLQITVPANVMGPNGALQFDQLLSYTNSAGAKTFATTWGGQSVFSAAPTTTQTIPQTRLVINRGVTNSQAAFTNALANYGNSTNAATASFVQDTTQPTTVLVNMTLAAATDNMMSEFLRIVAFYGP